MLLAIDSGANCGWAVFHGKILIAAGFKKFHLPCRPEELTRIVVERPHTGKTKARKRDIITLAIRAGEVGGVWGFLAGRAPEYLEPQSWKGQVPKPEMNARVLRRLSEVERAIAGSNHNVLDAVGIGLHCLGRLP